jgi:hypothetical protein
MFTSFSLTFWLQIIFSPFSYSNVILWQKYEKGKNERATKMPFHSPVNEAVCHTIW